MGRVQGLFPCSRPTLGSACGYCPLSGGQGPAHPGSCVPADLPGLGGSGPSFRALGVRLTSSFQEPSRTCHSQPPRPSCPLGDGV